MLDLTTLIKICLLDIRGKSWAFLEGGSTCKAGKIQITYQKKNKRFMCWRLIADILKQQKSLIPEKVSPF